MYKALWMHSSKAEDHSPPNKYFYKDDNKRILLEQNNSNNNESNLINIQNKISKHTFFTLQHYFEDHLKQTLEWNDLKAMDVEIFL
jgi:hypothetical protein